MHHHAQDLGYSPDTLILTPGDREDLDLLVSGITGGTADFVFGVGNFAGGLFGLPPASARPLRPRWWSTAGAFGRLYASPVSLAKFEEAAGSTNTSTVRLELNACFGTERVDAAVRIRGERHLGSAKRKPKAEPSEPVKAPPPAVVSLTALRRVRRRRAR